MRGYIFYYPSGSSAIRSLLFTLPPFLIFAGLLPGGAAPTGVGALNARRLIHKGHMAAPSSSGGDRQARSSSSPARSGSPEVVDAELEASLEALRSAVLNGDEAGVARLALELQERASNRRGVGGEASPPASSSKAAKERPGSAAATAAEGSSKASSSSKTGTLHFRLNKGGTLGAGDRKKRSLEPERKKSLETGERREKLEVAEQEEADYHQSGEEGDRASAAKAPPVSGGSSLKPAEPLVTESTDHGSTLSGTNPTGTSSPALLDSCLLDDRVFSLSNAAKLELAAELDTPMMADALKWVRRGGWWSCAYGGESCLCPGGEVRLVTMRDLVDSPANVKPVNLADIGEVAMTCTLSNFPDAAIAGVAKSDDEISCECKHPPKPDGTPNSADGFHLEKKLTSKSYLQESWIFLLRLLGRTNMLPLGTGDRTYSGMKNWSARKGFKPGGVLERSWIQLFVKEAVIPWVSGPKCLEWGNPATPGKGFIYAPTVPQCKETYDMQYDKVAGRPDLFHVSGKLVYSDILSMPTTLGPNLKMNTIFATQVFEHLNEPHLAASALFESLAPGGSVVFTAPMQAQFHMVPHDYFRYTVEGVKYLFVKAGFCVPHASFAGGGDFVMDIARDAGMQVQDFPMEEVFGAYQRGYEHVSHSAITIHALAFKPPHAACSDPQATTR